MCSSARTLTTFEVPVRRRGATLSWVAPVEVEAKAHGATGVTPLEARFAENMVKSLRLCGSSHPRRDTPGMRYRRGGGKVL